MASWLTPQRLEDAARVLRGVALVLGRATADSPALKRAGAADYERAVVATAELLSAHAQRARWGPSDSSQPTGSSQQAEPQFTAPSGSPLSGSVYPSSAAPLLAEAHRIAHPSAAAAGAAASHSSDLGAPTSQSHAGSASPGVSTTGRTVSQSSSSSSSVTAHATVPRDANWSNQPSPSSCMAGAASSSNADSAVSNGVSGSSSSSSSSRSHQAAAAPVEQWAEANSHVAGGRSAELAGPSTSSSTAAAAAHHMGLTSAEALQQQQQQQAATRPTAEVVGSWPSAAESVLTAAEQSDDIPTHLLGPAATSTAAAAAAARCSATAPTAEGPTAAAAAAASEAVSPEAVAAAAPPRRVLRERAVPSTQLGRAFGFASMGASLLLGTLKDNMMASLGPAEQQTPAAAAAGKDTDGSSSRGASGTPVYSSFITQSNAERLANALCRMRGAALKIGQMLSIQDESVLPPQIQSALERVRAGADVMPRRQLEKQLRAQLGRDWASQLSSFDWEPRAAASIGQVHAGVLLDGRQVALKVQYPGVARSIESDVDNLMRLVSLANILPRGLFVESAVKVAKKELAMECDYRYEAAAQGRFKALVEADPELAPHFHVPGVIPALSSDAVITTEWVNGVTIDKVASLSQEVRDRVGTQLLRLTLRELFDWGYMQTDPNWGNFLYDGDTGRLNLIDFGAAREYPRDFVEDYLAMVAACAERDRAGVIAQSQKLGFLTGDESEVMLAAHSEAGFVVGIPFATPGTYDFGTHSGLTPRVAELGAVMLKHRLTPPPEESYSLHRKLSGAFLACMKLRARVPCRELFLQTYQQQTGRRASAQHAAVREQQSEELFSQSEQAQVAGV